MRPRLERWAPALLLTALVIVSYVNTLGNQFVFDDLKLVFKFPEVRTLSGIPTFFSTFGRAPYYRPTRFATFAIDYQLSGEEPWAFHVSNMAYHLLTVFAVYALLRRVIGYGLGLGSNGGAGGGAGPPGGPLDAARLPALAGAAIFAVHPVHTEVVAYISGRRDVLAGLLYFLAFLGFVRYRETGRWPWLILTFAAWPFALLSKEIAVTLPAAFVLYDVFVLGRGAGPHGLAEGGLRGIVLAVGRSLWRSKGLLAVLFVLAAGAVYGAVKLASGTTQVTYHGGSAVTQFLTQLRVLAHYIGLLFFPVTLQADYSTNAFPLSASLRDPRIYPSAAVLLPLLYAAVRCYPRRRLVSLAIFWFFVTILPICHIIPHHELLAEHHLYIPSFGLALVAGLGVRAIVVRTGSRSLAYGALAAVLAIGVGRTVIRNRDWKDGETLWRATVAVAPECARARVNLATILYHAGLRSGDREKLREAEEHFDAGLTWRTRDAVARMELAKIYVLTGRKDAARREYERVWSIVKGLQWSRLAKGDVLVALGDLSEGAERRAFFDWAAEAYEQDIRVKPKMERGPLLHALCSTHERRENLAAALATMERLLKIFRADVPGLRRAADLCDRLAERGAGPDAERYRRRAASYRSRADRIEAQARRTGG